MAETLRDALRALDDRLFVGRAREIAAFQIWLLEEVPLPSILNVSGRGGVGKTALLGAFWRVAEDLARAVLSLDGHDMVPTPEGLLNALADLLGVEAGLEAVVLALNGAEPVLLLDTFEELTDLTRFLQETLFPRLSTGVRLVIAGRYPLGRLWSRDGAWRTLIQPLALDAFSAEESLDYLARRGIADHRLSERIRQASGGHPLALTLAADLVTHLCIRNFTTAPEWHLTVRDLVEQLLQDVSEPDLRVLLEAGAIVRQFDEETLAALVGPTDVGLAFNQLCRLSVVQPTERGLTLHDDVRLLIAEDLRWRRRERYDELRLRALEHYRTRMATASGAEREWLLTERLYLWEHAFVQAFLFGKDDAADVWIEPARAEDLDDVMRLEKIWHTEILPTITTIEYSPEFGGPAEHLASFEQLVRYPSARIRMARGDDGQAIGFNLVLPICQDSMPLLVDHAFLGQTVRAYFPPERRATLPIAPSEADTFYLVQSTHAGEKPEAVTAALWRDFLGLLGRGGVYIVTLGLPVHVELFQSFGFEVIPGSRQTLWGERTPSHGCVLNLKQIGFERWIEAIMAGRRPPRILPGAELERELRELLPHWLDDVRLGESVLAESVLIDTALPTGQRPAALRTTVRRALASARAGASEEQALALRAVELAYLTPDLDISREAVATRLSVSRRTLFRLLERGTHVLAIALTSVLAALPDSV